jgi:hypothetical protein
MNKLYGEDEHSKFLLCILEPGNIHRLTTERQPIEINLNDKDGPWAKGLPAKVTIHIAYSETPVSDASELRKLMPDLKIKDRRAAVVAAKRPHCPECKSTVEELGVWRSEESPLWIVFCASCGAVFGTTPPVAGLEKKKP